MSTSVLARLKVKPVPNKIEQIKVRIAEPATEERVEIQTKVLDKTKDNTINRAEFIKKLKGVVESSKVKESAPQPIISKPPVKKAKKIAKKLKLIPDERDEETSKTAKGTDTDTAIDVNIRRTPKPNMDIIVDDIDMDQIVGDAKLI